MPEPTSNPSRLDAISTRWSLLRQARPGSTTSNASARSMLVLRYTPAIRRYVRALVVNESDAEDIAQDVVVRLLAGDFAGANPARGRFRDLLKTSIRNMVRNYWRRGKLRQGADVDVERLQQTAEESSEDLWLASWRRQVLDLAWNALKREERSRPDNMSYTVLRLRVSHPTDSSEQLAARLCRKTGRQVRAAALRQKLRRARLRFADLLIGELANGLERPTPRRIEDEMIVLGLLEPMKGLLPPGWADSAAS